MAILDIGTKPIIAILNLHVVLITHIIFQIDLIYCSGRDVENVKSLG